MPGPLQRRGGGATKLKRSRLAAPRNQPSRGGPLVRRRACAASALKRADRWRQDGLESNLDGAARFSTPAIGPLRYGYDWRSLARAFDGVKRCHSGVTRPRGKHGCSGRVMRALGSGRQDSPSLELAQIAEPLRCSARVLQAAWQPTETSASLAPSDGSLARCWPHIRPPTVGADTSATARRTSSSQAARSKSALRPHRGRRRRRWP
jgi:hypothetical protein